MMGPLIIFIAVQNDESLWVDHTEQWEDIYPHHFEKKG